MSSRTAVYSVSGRTIERGPWRTIAPGLMAADFRDVATGIGCRLLRWQYTPQCLNPWRSHQDKQVTIYARVECGYVPEVASGDEIPVLDERRRLDGWLQLSEYEMAERWVQIDASFKEARR